MAYTLTPPRLWYERRGRGEPLLLITGFAISAAVFEPVLPLYESHFDCIYYDNRTSGRSDASAWPASVAQFAGDAARLLEEIGVESAHAYGVSMGGMIAQELAIRFPEKVRGLILGGTTPGGPRAVRPALGELATLLGRAGGALREPGRPWLGAMLFSPRFRREQPARVRELLEYFARHRASPHGLAAHWWATVYHDTVSRLHRIQAPTLVMHGGCDAMSPVANARLLAEEIPDAELVIMPDAGHAYALERPEESLAMVLDWLARRGTIAAGRSHSGFTARAEPLTRALGLPVGALRTGASLLRVRRKRRGAKAAQTAKEEGDVHVAADRRAA
jgi:3-oxoadipate enol-lactonase